MLQVRSEWADAHTPPTRQKTKQVCLIGKWLSLAKHQRARGHSMRCWQRSSGDQVTDFHRHVANSIGSRSTCRGRGLSGSVVKRAAWQRAEQWRSRLTCKSGGRQNLAVGNCDGWVRVHHDWSLGCNSALVCWRRGTMAVYSTWDSEGVVAEAGWRQEEG